MLWLQAGEEHKTSTREGSEHWLNELVRHHAMALGAKTGKNAVDVFVELIRKVFNSEIKKKNSSLYRPAIEGHDRNYRWHAAENISVEGLRDALLGWSGNAPDQTRAFLKGALVDEQDILRRIGIYIVGERWTEYRALYEEIVGPEFFYVGHRHEVYELLKQHFLDFDDPVKARTLKSIEQIPLPKRGDDPEVSLKWTQLKWLSAIEGKGYVAAEEWIAQLKSDLDLQEPLKHPEFNSYIESSWVGPGPTPYTVQELVGFAQTGAIVERSELV